MKLQTVNVIRLDSGCLDSIYSFPDTPEGNREAESKFHALILDIYEAVDPVEIEAAIENGHFAEDRDEILLAHST